MEIKDVIHYYLGQNVVYENKIYSLRSINKHSIKTGSNGCFIFIDADDCHWVHLKDIQLLIRPLASMTKEEMEECGNLIYDFRDDPELNRWEPQDFEIGLAIEQFHYLLSCGFDLFNLIPRGLAVEESKTLNT